MTTQGRRGRRPGVRRRWAALAVVAALAGGTVVAAVPAAAGPAADPWVSLQTGGYYRFTVPQQYVKNLIGETPGVVSAQGSIGPNGTWSDLALDASGSNYVGTVGPLAPGLYTYQYTVVVPSTGATVTFKEPTSPAPVTAHPTWNTFLVPGASVDWMSDLPVGGSLETLEYASAVTGTDRDALVWTPPGYDADRAQAYPVLYLLDGSGQSYREWAELGRAPQILDNLAATATSEPMVVVMADGDVPDARAEVLDNLLPAARGAFNISSQPSQQAIAGVDRGGYQALSLLVSDPGTFGYVGSFSGYLYGSVSASAADAINAGTSLVRLYVGNQLDAGYNKTYALRQNLAAAGVEFEFDGVNPTHTGWDAWREGLRDFASRLFHDVADHGPSAGHVAQDAAYVAPAAGSITTPVIGENNLVTFETGTQWATAKSVTVWANWAPNGAWLRIPMTKVGDRWRLTLGPLDGFYYYHYVVDGVDVKDPADTVNTLTSVSPLYVPGATDRMLGDVPAGKGGTVSELSYFSTVANEQRKALVWTPPGYDPNRAEPYPVLYLNHGAGQSYGDWTEVGRAKQILDNHYLDGTIVPMVVVMGNGNVSDFQKELFDNLMPAARSSYRISTDPSQQALAGLSMGAMNTITTTLTRPGNFAYVGAFSGFLFGMPSFDAATVNAGTKMFRLYSGDASDFTHDFTVSLMQTFDQRGVRYEFPGFTVGPHGFDTWQQNLIDFLPRIFKGDQTTGIPVTAQVPDGENGYLALTVADYGSGVALAQAANVGDRLRFEGALPSVTVTDSRNVKQAGAGGWTVTGQASTFASSGASLGAEHLGWTPTVATPRQGLTPGEPVGTVLDRDEGLAVASRLATADAEGRFGTATLGADLRFEVPVGTAPGTYTGTLTVSLFPVD